MTDEDTVVERELLLLSPDIRRDPERILALLHPDFLEFGSSGRTWDRSSVTAVTAVTAASAAGIRARDVRTRRLGPAAMLVTYTSSSEGRAALRSSTWVRQDGEWLLLFHQGTRLADG